MASKKQKASAKKRFIAYCFASGVCSKGKDGKVKGINKGNAKTMAKAMTGDKKAQKKVQARKELISSKGSTGTQNRIERKNKRIEASRQRLSKQTNDAVFKLSKKDAKNVIKRANKIVEKKGTYKAGGSEKALRLALKEKGYLPKTSNRKKNNVIKVSTKKTKAINEEAYLASKGAGRGAFGEPALHHNKGRNSDKTWSKMVNKQADKDRKLADTRQKLRSEYNKKVSKGELRPMSRKEQLIATAKGHPDNPAVQAAQRLLKKKGIKWN